MEIQVRLACLPGTIQGSSIVLSDITELDKESSVTLVSLIDDNVEVDEYDETNDVVGVGENGKTVGTVVE